MISCYDHNSLPRLFFYFKCSALSLTLASLPSFDSNYWEVYGVNISSSFTQHVPNLAIFSESGTPELAYRSTIDLTFIMDSQLGTQKSAKSAASASIYSAYVPHYDQQFPLPPVEGRKGTQKSAKSGVSASIYSEYPLQDEQQHSSPQSDRPDIDEELKRLKQEQEQYISRQSSLQYSPTRPRPFDFPLPERQQSMNENGQYDVDAQWGDPYPTTNAPMSSPPMSSASFRSKGSARSRGSHRAPRKASTPARFEPFSEGRPLDSLMAATIPTSPAISGSQFPHAASTASQEDRELSIVPSIMPTRDEDHYSSIVPSIVPTPNDQRSLSIQHSIAPTYDEHDPSSMNDRQRLDPSILSFTPSNFDRNASIASNRTIPNSIFKDFDGVHMSPTIGEDIKEENEEEVLKASESKEMPNFLNLNESAVRPTSEYELWFQEQFNQAEQNNHEEVQGQRRVSHVASIHGASDLDDGSKPQTPQPWAEPPPKEGMDYYPAPVPRDIKLPQRLSRQLPSDVMAKRRSQVLGELDSEARKSAVWLKSSPEHSPARAPPEEGSPAQALHKKKRSSAQMKNLPPQLRASLFFEHEAVPQTIEMKHGSATATLEHLLDQSVMGPTNEDLDNRHPDAVGRQRPQSIGLDTNGRSSRASMLDHRTSRSSMLDNTGRSSRASMLDNTGRSSRASMLSGPLDGDQPEKRGRSRNKLRKRSLSADRLTQAGNRSSTALDHLDRAGNRSSSVLDHFDGAHTRNSSAMSLSRFSFEGKRNSSALDIEHPVLRVTNGSEDAEAYGEGQDDFEIRSHIHQLDGHDTDSDMNVIHMGGEPGEEQEIEEEQEEKKRDSDEFDETIHGPPTTLLAELQLRKQKLKQRNRTAVSAFPDGMHSTLLELDAVAQIEKKRRKGKPTTLAWEDPSAKGTPQDVDDDDTPLGMLYPGQNTLLAKGRNHWDQPLGLLQQKEREENEPLSKRRARLRPQQPISAQQVQRQQAQIHHHEQASPNGQQKDDDSEHEGETLAQRTRRLRSTRALDDAIGGSKEDGRSRALSGDFASEMMSTFGPVENEKKDVDGETRASPVNAADGEAEGETLGQRRMRLQREAAVRQVSGDSTDSKAGLLSNPSMSNLLAQVPPSQFASRQASGESRLSVGLLGESEAKRLRDKQDLADRNFRSGSGMGINHPLVDTPGAKGDLNRGGAGNRQSFMPGQYSGMRSKSSTDILQQQGQQTPHQQPQPNPWAGFAPQSFQHGLGAVGSDFQQNKSPGNNPFPHFPGNSGNAMFASDPKGGVRHNPNRGSMLWSQEHSRQASMLPRQWSDGNFGYMNGGMKTYAAHAMAPKEPSAEQLQTSGMTDLQRAKIEQWRTSVIH